MRAGKMDRRISIETYGLGGDDGWGNPAPTFTPRGTYRAEIVQGSSEEFFRGGGLAEVKTILFRTRFIHNVRPADRIAHEGVYFDILEVKEIGRRKGLEIRCASTGEDAPA